MSNPSVDMFRSHIARGRAMERAKALVEVHGTQGRYAPLVALLADRAAKLHAIPAPLNEHVEALALFAASEHAVVAELRRLDAETVPPPVLEQTADGAAP